MLRERRMALGKTQAAVARELRFHPSYLSQVEAGNRPLSARFLIRISGPLEVEPIALLLQAGLIMMPGFIEVTEQKSVREQLQGLWDQLSDTEREETVKYMRYLLLLKATQAGADIPTA